MATKKQKKITNISLKMRLASRALADERYLDSDDEAALRLVKAGLIRKELMYYALHHFGYSWDVKNQCWYQVYPEWMKNCHRPHHENYRLCQSER